MQLHPYVFFRNNFYVCIMYVKCIYVKQCCKFQVNEHQVRKLNVSFQLKMSFLTGNITFFNFVFQLQTLKYYYHYEHGNTNNQKCLSTWYVFKRFSGQNFNTFL